MLKHNVGYQQTDHQADAKKNTPNHLFVAVGLLLDGDVS